MKFVRRDSNRYSKIGKGRKKLQKWRRPKGRDNKMRENRKGYPKSVRVGFKTTNKESGNIGGLVPQRILTLKDLDNIRKDNLIIIGKVGAKRRIELIKKAEEMKLKIFNVEMGGKNAIK
jgi:large subunit ribosomal protein L32e